MLSVRRWRLGGVARASGRGTCGARTRCVPSHGRVQSRCAIRVGCCDPGAAARAVSLVSTTASSGISSVKPCTLTGSVRWDRRGESAACVAAMPRGSGR